MRPITARTTGLAPARLQRVTTAVVGVVALAFGPISVVPTPASAEATEAIGARVGALAARHASSAEAAEQADVVVTHAAHPDGHGYWLATAQGRVLPFLEARPFGDAEGVDGDPAGPLVAGMAPTATGDGYWLATTDGAVTAHGDAADLEASQPVPPAGGAVRSLVASPSGEGWWMVTGSGDLVAAGDAEDLGHIVGAASPIVGLAPAAQGDGYWLAAEDGNVTPFGSAAAAVAAPADAPAGPVTAIVPTPTGEGYWLATATGDVVAAGDAHDLGDAKATAAGQRVVGLVASPSGGGYTLLADSGETWSFGDAELAPSRFDRTHVLPALGAARDVTAVARSGGQALQATEAVPSTAADLGAPEPAPAAASAPTASPEPASAPAPPEPELAAVPESVAASEPDHQHEPVETTTGPSDENFDRLAQCESGGDWAANTGNGYYGGLQFSDSSWQGVGGTGLAHEHSRATQIEMGRRLYNAQGWGAWPSCSRQVGLR
ncbi:hypothetical protein BH20ACT2_BH20ACT2_04690 [soil metagenome]